jgi:hypothetical protein
VSFMILSDFGKSNWSRKPELTGLTRYEITDNCGGPENACLGRSGK